MHLLTSAFFSADCLHGHRRSSKLCCPPIMFFLGMDIFQDSLRCRLKLDICMNKLEQSVSHEHTLVQYPFTYLSRHVYQITSPIRHAGHRIRGLHVLWETMPPSGSYQLYGCAVSTRRARPVIIWARYPEAVATSPPQRTLQSFPFRSGRQRTVGLPLRYERIAAK